MPFLFYIYILCLFCICHVAPPPFAWFLPSAPSLPLSLSLPLSHFRAEFGSPVFAFANYLADFRHFRHSCSYFPHLPPFAWFLPSAPSLPLSLSLPLSHFRAEFGSPVFCICQLSANYLADFRHFCHSCSYFPYSSLLA